MTTENNSIEPSDDEWDSLTSAIRKKNCILVLGPKAAVDPRDPLEPVLPVQLAQQMIQLLMKSDALPEQPIELREIPIDNLALIAQYYKREFKARKYSPRRNVQKLIELTYLVKDFYDPIEDLTTSLHQDLASLPFRVCLCVTQDRMMLNALRDAGKTPVEAWYSLKSPQAINADEFTVDSPLVSHLLGRASDRLSVVMTQDDMMDLAIGLTRKETSLDEKLVRHLHDEETVFLFVGFGFGSNYSKFLLKLLSNRQSDDDESRDFFFEDIESSEKHVALLYQDCPTSFFRTPLLQFTKQLRERLRESGDVSAAVEAAAPLTTKMPLVFLCHCSDDKPKIDWMPEAFRTHGVECWIDTDGLRGGEAWDSKIMNLIQEKIDYFMIIASESMLKHPSSYFYKEIKLGLEKRALVNENYKYIFPIVLDCPKALNTKMLLGKINVKLGEFQAFDFQKDQQQEFLSLVNEIKADVKERLSWQQI